MVNTETNLLGVYQKLLSYFGKQNWWPAKRNFESDEWEICLGAILTQNTNWRNVEKALDNLNKHGKITVKSISEAPKEELTKIIRPAGFYNQKAERLKTFSKFVLKFGSLENFLKNVKREELLKLKGIGPETANSILLYAGNRPYFVVDAYTRRVFSRLGFIDANTNYETIRKFFEKNLPRDVEIYKEFHALIVELAKKFCRKNPLCNECPLKNFCK
jgi:endonuclease-3 related protein